jgi:hypothetical protein
LVASDGTTPVTSGNVAPGMKLIVTAEDGVTTAVYEFIVRHIALKKTASADATENTTNTAAKAVDGDMTTRWAAPNNATSSAPHWWEVDLGKNYFLNEIGVYWFDNETNHRTYRYTVSAKKSGESTYATIVNRSNNEQRDLVTDSIADKIGRHVRIHVTGTKENVAYNYPSIYEVSIYGWTIESTTYTIDYENLTITVPASDNLLLHNAFLSNITFLGNETHRIESAAYYIADGDSLVITDVKGKETSFAIRVGATGLPALDGDSQAFTVSNTDGLIHIRLLKESSAHLRIFDAAGKTMVSQKIGKTFDYPLPKGVYLIDAGDDKTIKYRLQ